MTDWLSADEALTRLRVRPQTLYAYVSRGRVRAEPDPTAPRRSRYRASDVAALAERKARGRKAADVAGAAIEWGEPVLASGITTVRDGRLYYRGQDAVRLAESATLEAVAYGFRHHVEVLADIGYGPKRFLASDGGTRSRVWMQIMADVLQAPIRLIENAHGSAIGAAFVAAVATGADVTWADAGRLAKLGATIEPRVANAMVYEHGYRDFRALYEALKPLFGSRAG